MGGRLVVRTLLGVAVLPVFIAVAVNAATDATFPGPLRLIQQYPWQSVLFGLICAGAYAVWELRSPHDRRDLTAAEQDRLRARLLGETRRIWVDGVLARSLGEVLRLELSLVTQQSRVTHPVHVLLRGAADETLTGVPPAQVFARLGERLLILGEPGAGKTTMLLELARDLVVRAEEQTSAQVPVVLNLSSWPSGDNVDFEDWIAGELRRFYDIPDRDARYVIEHGMAALLLDGLDEVPGYRLPKCVTALNTFRDKRGDMPVVVTCRVADYDEQVKPLLKLAGAVRIQPLTPAETDTWLASIGPPLGGLRRALRADESLREMLRTPLTLNIAALAYQDRQVGSFTGLDSLFAAYTRRMLERPRAPLADTKTYTDDDVRRWLASLARGMTAANASAISPTLATRLRAVWVGDDAVPWKRLPRMMFMLGVVPMALLAGVTTLLLGSWWAAMTTTGLTAAVAWVRADTPNWFSGHVPQEANHLTLRENHRREAVGTTLLIGQACVSLLVAVILLQDDFSRSDAWWLTQVITAVVMIFYIVVTATSVTYGAFGLGNIAAEVAHEAMGHLARWAGPRGAATLSWFIAGASAGCAGAGMGFVVGALANQVFLGEQAWKWNLALGWAAGLLLAPVGGLILAAQYAVTNTYTPRVVYRHVAKSGALPADLRHFLAWADDRLLLRKAGDDYVFVHLLYRDWWATQAAAPR